MTKNKIRQVKIKCNLLFQDQIPTLRIHSKTMNFMTMLLKELINFKQGLLIDKLSLRWIKKQENKGNFSRNKVNKDKRREKNNGTNFLRLKEISRAQINLSLPQLQLLKKKNNQVGKILLIILQNKLISLHFREPLQRKVHLFHKIMKKFADKCKGNSV